MRASGQNHVPTTPDIAAALGDALRAAEAAEFAKTVSDCRSELDSMREGIDVAIATTLSRLHEHDKSILAAKERGDGEIAIRPLIEAKDEAECVLQELREDKRRVKVFADELGSIESKFAVRDSSRAEYAAALYRNDEYEDRSGPHRRYEEAPMALARWSADWQRQKDVLAVKLHVAQIPAFAAQVDAGYRELSECRASVRAERVSMIDELMNREFPKGAGSLTWLTMARQLLGSAEVAEQATAQQVAHARAMRDGLTGDDTDMRKMHDDSLRYALIDWIADKNVVADAKQRYLRKLHENIDGLSAGAVHHLAWPPSAEAELCAATTWAEVESFATRHLNTMEKLRADITAGGKFDEDSFGWKWEAARDRIFRDAQIQKAAIQAEAAVAKQRQHFPPYLRTPTRFPDTGQANLRTLLDPGYRRLIELREESAHTATFFATPAYFAAAEEFFGLSGLRQQLDAVVRERNRPALDALVTRIATGTVASRLLVACPNIYLGIMVKFARAYRLLESDEARLELLADGAAARAAKPAKRTEPRAEKSKTDAAKVELSSNSSAEEHEEHEEDSDADSVEGIESSYVADAAAIEAADWIAVREPATWTRFRSFDTGEVMYLGDVNRTLESRARNLWNWSQEGMAGNATQLMEARECVALIDWIISSSGEELEPAQRLFSRGYAIACGPGTGDFAGTADKPNHQLKIINTDPDAPKVNGKQPTFHINVDPEAVAAVNEALAQRGFG